MIALGKPAEQLYSPLNVDTTPEHAALKDIASGCITKHHSHPYLGFAATQWELFQKENPPRLKPLLYVYRVPLRGIHLMRTGTIEANLETLNDEFRLPWIPGIIQYKVNGAERGKLESGEVEFHCNEYRRLIEQLETAALHSQLPDEPSWRDALNDLLVRIRLASNDPIRGAGRDFAEKS